MPDFDPTVSQRRIGWAGAFERSLRRRVALAVTVSLALHFALFANVDWAEIFHAEKAEGPPLRARIAPLKAAAPAPVAAAPVAKPKPRPAPRRPKAVEAVAPPTAPATVPVVEAPQAEPALAPRPEPVLEPKPEPAVEAAKPAAVPVAPAPDAPIAFPERIDLEFNLMKGADGAPVGRVVHRFERQGERYLIRSTTEATGLGALFASGRFVQESEGVVTAHGLRPERFVVRRGRAERTETATFDWAAAKATLAAGGATREWALRPGAQDLLSFMHQLSFVVGEASPPPIWVTSGRRFDTVRIEVVGKATVETDLGPLAAVHFRNHSGDEGLRFEVWLAPDYGNLPVKIRLRDRRGEEIEQVLSIMRIR